MHPASSYTHWHMHAPESIWSPYRPTIPCMIKDPVSFADLINNFNIYVLLQLNTARPAEFRFARMQAKLGMRARSTIDYGTDGRRRGRYARSAGRPATAVVFAATNEHHAPPIKHRSAACIAYVVGDVPHEEYGSTWFRIRDKQMPTVCQYLSQDLASARVSIIDKWKLAARNSQLQWHTLQIKSTDTDLYYSLHPKL
jgi:hypothetical protein